MQRRLFGKALLAAALAVKAGRSIAPLNPRESFEDFAKVMGQPLTPVQLRVNPTYGGTTNVVLDSYNDTLATMPMTRRHG